MMAGAVKKRRRRQQWASWRPVGRAHWEGSQLELSEGCQARCRAGVSRRDTITGHTHAADSDLCAFTYGVSRLHHKTVLKS